MRPLCLASVVLAFLSQACTSELALEELTKTPLGPAGGVAHSADGLLTLRVPPGALSTEVMVTVQPQAVVATDAVSRVYRLGPGGLTFDLPVTLTVRLSAAAALTPAAGRIYGVALHTSTGPEPVAGGSYDATSRTATAPLRHFSDYGVFSLDCSALAQACPISCPEGVLLDAGQTPCTCGAVTVPRSATGCICRPEGLDCTISDVCLPQDAHGVTPELCRPCSGYAWNGSLCQMICGCGCEGEDCGETYLSLETCESEHEDCNPLGCLELGGNLFTGNPYLDCPAASHYVRTADAPVGGTPFCCVPDNVCFVGVDQSCNHDPAASSFWGHCETDGSCSCNDGFFINPSSGKCWTGPECSAGAGGDTLCESLYGQGFTCSQSGRCVFPYPACPPEVPLQPSIHTPCTCDGQLVEPSDVLGECYCGQSGFICPIPECSATPSGHAYCQTTYGAGYICGGTHCVPNQPVAIATLRTCPDALCTDPAHIQPLDRVYFDGRQSYDPLEPGNPTRIAAYAWEVIAYPAGCNPVDFGPQGQTASLFSFWVPLAGTYTVRLKVWNTDGLGSADTETARLTFSAVPGEALQVQLTWDDATNDQDLHLVHLAADPRVCNDLSDCYYANRSPQWFGTYPAGQGPNPFMDIDDANGLGPENINIDSPLDGTYRVFVHYYRGGSTAPTRNTVRVYFRGMQVAEYRRTLSEKQLWAVGDVVWNNGFGQFLPYPSDATGQVGSVATMDNCAAPGFVFP